MYERLSRPVVSLHELNSAFGLLQELSDMENSIDDVYLPVENIYAKLRYTAFRVTMVQTSLRCNGYSGSFPAFLQLSSTNKFTKLI